MIEVGRMGGERNGDGGKPGRALNSRKKEDIYEVPEMSKEMAKP